MSGPNCAPYRVMGQVYQRSPSVDHGADESVVDPLICDGFRGFRVEFLLPPEHHGAMALDPAQLQQAAKEQPLLLVVDDLPWLDRASALVLGMVARRLAGLPVALLAAGRTGEPRFFDQGNLPVARLEPLSEEAATELLASRYPVMTARVRRRLLDAALGNPLALLKLPVSLGDLAQTVAGTLPAALPPGRRLQAAFASRVQALPPSVYDLLLLAVLDGTGELRLIRALAADRQGQGLESAERAGLVRADESTARLTFRHPLIRSAISTSSTHRY